MQEYVLIERLTDSPGIPARVVVFDFDGTVGMIRAGWMPLMLDMMMETLEALGPDPGLLRDEAEDYVARNTGRDTVEQMNAFADHVRRLGGTPRSGAGYKAEFLARLEHRRSERLDALRTGRIQADALMIPGSRPLLENLAAAGLPVYLASGSEHQDICLEARLLGIEQYFAGIYGSAPGIPDKAGLMAELLARGFAASSILTFGDGRTEIEVTRAIGGRTVGVASDEPECLQVDAKKRTWLIAAGADYIIPNYLETDLMKVVEARF